jgi:hypothetical protein
MKRLFPTFLLALAVLPAAARADDAPPSAIGCGIVTNGLVGTGPNQVMISCTGASEEFGAQLAGILTYVLQRRLDPELVIVKLDEIEGLPPGDAPRSLTADQGQAIVQSLYGKPPEQIAVVAHPQGADTSDYAVALASRLAMAGWQIDGNQIRRVIPPGLDEIAGLVLVVRNDKAPPEKAVRLKAAMAAAKILLPIISDPTLPADGALLWVGKKPSFNTATQ